MYCKRPFGSAERVVKYFGLYTYRVALSNDRIVGFDGKTVVLGVRTDKDKDRRRTLKLTATEFIRRYLFHVLPDRFVKIRYYGLLGNCRRVERLERCRRLLGCRHPRKRKDRGAKRDWGEMLLELTGIDRKSARSVAVEWSCAWFSAGCSHMACRRKRTPGVENFDALLVTFW